MLTRSCAPLFAALVLSVPGKGSAQPTSGTARLLPDGNRIYAELEFVRPDGSRRNTLAFVDLGGPAMIVSLAQPDTLKFPGTPVPVSVNSVTGLAAVNITIDGHSYAATLDGGSAYTWLSQSVAHEWINDHPAWQRGIGAVGESNMRMEDDGIEAKGIVLRIPELALGPLRLQDVGVLAVGKRPTDAWDFMDWYSKKNQVPVIGWLGGNVLQGFRIAIDYPRRMSYWQPQRRLNSHDLDQVALTLARKHGEYFVTAIATRDGKAAVEGIQVGDKLLQIGSLSTHAASSSAVLEALSGKPGELRRLVVERGGKSLVVRASVTEF